jgi:hypothetical protein
MPSSSPTPKLSLRGLSYSDAAELQRLLEAPHPKADGEIKEEVLPSHKLGEPVTLFLVASATTALIGVVGTYLNKKRKTSDLRYTIEIEYPDGTKRTETLALSRSESEPPPPELVAKLADMTKLSGDEVKGLLH